jgi:hypothetical protein
MDKQNRRDSPRYYVTLYTEYVEREASPSMILNMSESGFLLRGNLCAGTGGIISATFKVRPSSVETRVQAYGKVVRSRRIANEYEYGVTIEGFGSPEEEEAYRSYVRELAERGDRQA